MHVCIFMQNAWSELYAGGPWPRESWLKALWRSKSGQGIRVLQDALIEAGHTVHIDNASPVVTASPKDKPEADLRHIWRVLSKQWPDVVIACGKVAEIACTEAWPWALVVTHHPAYRVATRELWQVVASLALDLIDNNTGKTRWVVVQAPGYVHAQELGGTEVWPAPVGLLG